MSRRSFSELIWIRGIKIENGSKQSTRVNWWFNKSGKSERKVRSRYLFGMVKTFEVVFTKKRAILGLSAVRHTLAEIHPEIVTSPFVPRYSPPRRHWWWNWMIRRYVRLFRKKTWFPNDLDDSGLSNYNPDYPVKGLNISTL